MGRQLSSRRRLAVPATFLGAVAGLVFAFAPAASENSTQDGLQASVTVSNRGPLHVCPSGCDGGDTTWNFVYVSNKNDLGDVFGHTRNRTTLPNSFVVTGVEQAVFVDGELYDDFTFTPPPYPNFPSYSGHWPSTVVCPPEGPPCNVVLSPAVIPGEDTAIAYLGWSHGPGEPNGRYVFRYTVHGSVNGVPADVTTSSVPIFMTD